MHGTTANTTVRKKIGKCIYCSSLDNLTDEHCIPESLNGVYLLEKGSCRDCAVITGRFEGNYARNSLLPVRTAWNMKSKRSKKKRPTEFPMTFVTNGVRKELNVPVNDHLSVVPLIEIGAPGRYAHLIHSKGLKSGEYEITAYNIRDEKHIEYLKEKYEADEVSVDFQIHVKDFLRMIAKIGYCFSIWRFGFNFQEIYVVPAILGQKDDIHLWVGSDGQQYVHKEARHMKADHVVVTTLMDNGEVIARVKLFKKSLTPEYDVIVGRLTPLMTDFYKSIGY